MKIAIIVGNPKKNFLSKLTSIFTQCAAYHAGFLDEETGMFYDMYWLRRRRKWPRYDEQQVILFSEDNVTREYLEEKLSTDDSEYGFLDYLSFALKPIYHIFGKSTRNAGGLICSELIVRDIVACGGSTPFDPEGSPPSPCDLLSWLMKERASSYESVPPKA